MHAFIIYNNCKRWKLWAKATEAVETPFTNQLWHCPEADFPPSGLQCGLIVDTPSFSSLSLLPSCLAEHLGQAVFISARVQQLQLNPDIVFSFINPTLKNIQVPEEIVLNCVLCRRVHVHACVLGCVCTYYGPKRWCQSCYCSYLRLVFLNEITVKADTLKEQSLNQTFHWKNLLRIVYVLRIPLVVH